MAELTEDFLTRPYREGDEEGILGVLQSAFGRWPHAEIAVEPIDHLRWKLRSNETALEHHVIGEVDGRIAGAQLSLIQRVKVSDRVLLSRQGIDAAVAADEQNKRIYSRMRESRREMRPAVEMTFGTRSPHPAMARIWNRRRDPLQASVLVRPLRPHAGRPAGLAQTLSPGWALLRTAGTTAVWVLNALRDLRPDRSPFPWSITSAMSFDDRVDALWAEASQGFEFIVARTRQYLNWRYSDRRAGDFTVRLAEKDGGLLGYSALRCSYGRGYIADLLILPGRSDVADSLIKDAVRYFRQRRLSAVECWSMPHDPHRGLYARNGFFDSRRKVALWYSRRRMEQAGVVSQPGRHPIVYLTIGDTDFV